MLRKLLGIAPRKTNDGAYAPSALALKLSTSAKTDYDGGVYPSPYKGNARVLVVLTERRNMTMANGKEFSTGNHPLEMALPMLHLLAAGFELNIVTPTGAPAAIEMWAMPKDDTAVKNLFQTYKEAIEKPASLAKFVESSLNDNSPYAAVFIPGGHGAMLGLPQDKNVGRLLRWAHKKDLLIITLCHGPGVLMAAKNEDGFIFDGYKIALFPDSVDKQTPMVGYLPGHMPFELGKKLREMGMTIVNKKADKTCHVDRKLITGASPYASNNLGRLAAERLLEAMK